VLVQKAEDMQQAGARSVLQAGGMRGRDRCGVTGHSRPGKQKSDSGGYNYQGKAGKDLHAGRRGRCKDSRCHRAACVASVRQAYRNETKRGGVAPPRNTHAGMPAIQAHQCFLSFLTATQKEAYLQRSMQQHPSPRSSTASHGCPCRAQCSMLGATDRHHSQPPPPLLTC
jgi:hypothetical protein